MLDDSRVRPSPGFPNVVVRIPQYGGSMTAALKNFGENLNSGLERWLRRLGGNPQSLPTLEYYKDLPLGRLKERIDARLEADRQITSIEDDEERKQRIVKLSVDMRDLVLSTFPAVRGKGAPRKHGDRDTKLWRLYRLERIGSYGQIGLRPEFRLSSHAVAAAIKRKDAEAEEFRRLISSLKEPLGILGIRLVWEALPRSFSSQRKNPDRN